MARTNEGKKEHGVPGEGAQVRIGGGVRVTSENLFLS